MREDLDAVLDIFLDSRLRQVHTCMPGKIVSYDSKKRKATVQPCIKPKFIAGNVIKSIKIEPITNVPVIFEGTKKFSFKYPLKKGDGCLLLFSESPIGNYLSNSTDDSESDNLTRFSLTDCIAIPGLFSFLDVPANCDVQFEIDDQDKITIKSTTGKIDIEKTGNITLNDGAESYVKGDTIKTMFLTLCSSIAAITPSNPVTAAQFSALQSAFSAFNGQLGNILSTQIKGK